MQNILKKIVMKLQQKLLKQNSFLLKSLAQDLFPKSKNINVQFFKNPNDKLVFNNFSLKSVNPGKFF